MARESAYEEKLRSDHISGDSGHFVRRANRWLVGFILFYGVIAGACYGFLVAPTTPWWSWACIAIIAFVTVRAIPGRIRNGYWGSSSSGSAWGVKSRRTVTPPLNRYSALIYL